MKTVFTQTPIPNLISISSFRAKVEQTEKQQKTTHTHTQRQNVALPRILSAFCAGSPTTCPCPDPAQFNVTSRTHFLLTHFNTVLPFKPRSSKCALSLIQLSLALLVSLPMPLHSVAVGGDGADSC